MAYIQSHQSLRRHRKVMKAARILDIEWVHLVGHLHCLWWWALDNTPDGCLLSVDKEDLATGAEWNKDPVIFYDALTNAGFIDLLGAKHIPYLHDWEDYSSAILTARHTSAQRMRKLREKNKLDVTESDVTCDVTCDDVPASHVTRCDAPIVEKSRVEKSNAPYSPPMGEDVAPESSTTKRSRKKVVYSPWLEDVFWKSYPNKGNKPGAQKALDALKLDDALKAAILAGLARAKTSRQWQREKGEFIPHAATWLHREGWLEDGVIHLSEQPSQPAPVEVEGWRRLLIRRGTHVGSLWVDCQADKLARSGYSIDNDAWKAAYEYGGEEAGLKYLWSRVELGKVLKAASE